METPNEAAFSDESQKVDDVEKAQVMAEAESPLRDYAAQYDRSKDTPIVEDSLRKTIEISNNRPGQRTNISLQNDGSTIEYVGHSYKGFDKNMPDEEIRDIISKRSEDAKNEAENRGDLAGDEFEQERQAKLAEVKKELGIE